MIKTNYHCNFCHADYTTKLDLLHGVKMSSVSAMSFTPAKDSTEHICDNCRTSMARAMGKTQPETPVLSVANG